MKSLRLLLVLVPLLSCRTAAPPQADGKPAPPARRVVILSLDGAAAETLQRYWRQGAFTEGGFRQFFEKGQVADRLVPVNPTLTAVNHISLATGAVPGETGIVSNRFHPADAAFLGAVSGFDAPIGTETLWEAAGRQGKKVGIVTWPGADGKGEGGRRKGTWGLVYVNQARLDPEIATFDRAAWTPLERNDPRIQGLESFAPILKAGLPQRGFEVAALDRKNDGRTAYDALVPLVTPAARVTLAAGDWGSVPCTLPAEEGAAEGTTGGETTCLIKLLELASDLSAARIYLNGVFANAGYPDGFTRAFGDSGLLWPGPPDDYQLSMTWEGEPGIDLATWVEQSERFTGFFGAALRFAAARDDWDLLMGYMPTIDEAGHQLLLTDPKQPNFSPERRAELALARRRVWQAVDRELAALLRVLDLSDTRVVIVSDHGMMPIHTAIDPNVLLRDQALLATAEGRIIPEGTTAHAIGSGGSAHVYLDPKAGDRERLLADLTTLFNGWTLEGERPVARVVRREEAGEIGLQHPNSGDLILFAAPGYTFFGGGLREGKAAVPTPVLGTHGHLAGDPSLDGIYLALGAKLPKGSAGTVRSIDVAGRIAEWLRIEGPRRRSGEGAGGF
ncbi:MAG TPA: alkaline phosphatase family protein [Thermoanaerobaculia bacterium]|nr:alkaline phosphatase family protein [Thermoanaerobaculia bacterium]